MQCSLRSSVGRSHGKAERMVRFRQGAPLELSIADTIVLAIFSLYRGKTAIFIDIRAVFDVLGLPIVVTIGIGEIIYIIKSLNYY